MRRSEVRVGCPRVQDRDSRRGCHRRCGLEIGRHVRERQARDLPQAEIEVDIVRRMGWNGCCACTLCNNDRLAATLEPSLLILKQSIPLTTSHCRPSCAHIYLLTIEREE